MYANVALGGVSYRFGGRVTLKPDLVGWKREVLHNRLNLEAESRQESCRLRSQPPPLLNDQVVALRSSLAICDVGGLQGSRSRSHRA